MQSTSRKQLEAIYDDIPTAGRDRIPYIHKPQRKNSNIKDYVTHLVWIDVGGLFQTILHVHQLGCSIGIET